MIAVVLGFAVGDPGGATTLATVAFGLKGALLLAPLAFIEKPHWLHPLVFIGGVGFLLGWIPEAALVIEGLIRHPGLPGAGRSVLANSVELKFLADSLAISSIYAGYYVIARLLPPRVPYARHGKPRHVGGKLLLVLAVSLGAFLVLVNTAGGLGELALQRGLPNRERVSAQIGGGHWHFLVGILTPAVIVAAAVMESPRRSVLFWVGLVVAVGTEFITTGSRGGTIAILILVWLTFKARQGNLHLTRVLAFASVVVFAVGIMTQFRRASSQIETVDEFQVVGGPGRLVEDVTETLMAYSGSGLNDFPIFSTVPQSEEIILGESYLAVLAAPIPRDLWPGKPNGAGHQATGVFIRSRDAGVAVSAVAEAYWNFHVPGIVIVFFTWGAFLLILWRSISANPQGGLVALYIITLYYLEPQTDAVYHWLHLIVPAAAFLGLVSLRLFPSPDGDRRVDDRAQYGRGDNG